MFWGCHSVHPSGMEGMAWNFVSWYNLTTLPIMDQILACWCILQNLKELIESWWWSVHFPCRDGTLTLRNETNVVFTTFILTMICTNSHNYGMMSTTWNPDYVYKSIPGNQCWGEKKHIYDALCWVLSCFSCVVVHSYPFSSSFQRDISKGVGRHDMSMA